MRLSQGRSKFQTKYYLVVVDYATAREVFVGTKTFAFEAVSFLSETLT